MKLRLFIKNNITFILLWILILVNIFVNARMNIFRYNDFDFGKFDLGNMSQMLWTTLHGHFMYLTDYFGTNLPRWSMSHVDPILLLFLPLFAIYQHPLVLVFSQFILVILGAVVVYKIAELELDSKIAAFLISAAYLLNPSIGYLNATTGFHGVTVVVPFFLTAFYVFEKMYREKNFSKGRMILFWLMLVLTMSGKEQLPLYVILYGIFVMFFRSIDAPKFKFDFDWFKKFISLKTSKIALSMIGVGIVWFVVAFLIIIPAYSKQRVDGFQKFAATLQIDPNSVRNVDEENYFLGRYSDFGNSYSEVLITMVTNPKMVIKVLFSGDRIENLQRIFEPVGYMAILSPLTLIIASPDIFINFLTTVDGVGTSEITNHRVSMILPIVFISTIYGISFLAYYLTSFKKKSFPKIKKSIIIVAALITFGFSIYTTFFYNNPVYLWLQQAVTRRAFAKEFDNSIDLNKVKIGDVVKLTQLDNKDVECAQKVVNMIPAGASVSGPDYLGAQLSLRETYAIFPALYNQTDYVIVDVFSQKILTILDLQTNLVKDVVSSLIKDPNYQLSTGCGNLFVFKRVGPHTQSLLLPLQERYAYTEKYNYPILYGLTVVDFTLPAEVTRGVDDKAQIVYVKRDGTALEGFVLYMTYINKSTGELYQLANLPSFSINEPANWETNKHYIEDVDIALPQFINSGTYKVFVGMSNKIKTRNLYIGDIVVK